MSVPLIFCWHYPPHAALNGGKNFPHIRSCLFSERRPPAKRARDIKKGGCPPPFTK